VLSPFDAGSILLALNHRGGMGASGPRASDPAATLFQSRLSVIVPVYNEARTIAEVVRRVRAVPLDIELIVVDDGSTDGARAWLPVVAGVDRLIFHARNRGKGAAIRTGLAAATGDVVVIQDADLEVDPRDLVPMLERIERPSGSTSVPR
jgi:glycosyltransferase involved in cell wall biosynthesis